MQVIEQVGKLLMRDLARFPFQNHDARFVTLGRGLLRDEFLGQVKIEIRSSHRGNIHSLRITFQQLACAGMKNVLT